jgi:preprotein translocase subunit SecG
MIVISILTGLVVLILVLVVLAQNPKGGGMNQFTGGGNQLMGVKKTGDLLEKLTWGFGIALITLSIIATLVIKPASAEEEATEEPATEQNDEKK